MIPPSPYTHTVFLRCWGSNVLSKHDQLGCSPTLSVILVTHEFLALCLSSLRAVLCPEDSRGLEKHKEKQALTMAHPESPGSETGLERLPLRANFLPSHCTAWYRTWMPWALWSTVLWASSA